ncbi:MAG TPA: type II toxin-antitoxin system VapC family toxin [Polyangiales bacterium]|nr:type II toxin-antitoxin system VapC family toxin [Polyangiales bacterium]
MLDAVEVLPLDAKSAELAGGVSRLLLGRGEDIGVAYSLVAGVCLRHEATLLTRNRAHFARVTNLRLGTLS